MSLWNAPSLDNPFLTLPTLDESQLSLTGQIQAAGHSIQIPVDSAFILAFTQGPLSHSPTDVANAMSAMVPAFMALIRAGQDHVDIRTKTHPGDFVTEMDLGIEMIIRIWIYRFFPGHKVIGEEGTKPSISTDDYVWYLDPVDGTSNYVGNSHVVGLNIGILRAGKPFVSVIASPFDNQFFIGDVDSGTVSKWHNGSISKFQFQAYSGPAKIGTEFSLNVHSTHAEAIRLAGNFEIVRIKSICQNLAALLLGQTTGFYKVNVKLWDIIAPLSLIHWAAKDFFTIELIYPSEGYHYTHTNLTCESIFSNSSSLIRRFNTIHTDRCKAGIIFVYPDTFSKLKNIVLDQYATA